PDEAHGEFIGMAMFSAAGAAALRAVHRELTGRGTKGLERASVTHLLQALIDRGHPAVSVGIHKGWMEIDTVDDYRRAGAEVSRCERRWGQHVASVVAADVSLWSPHSVLRTAARLPSRGVRCPAEVVNTRGFNGVLPMLAVLTGACTPRSRTSAVSSSP